MGVRGMNSYKNSYKIIGLFLTSIIISTVGSVSFAGCADNAEDNTVIPAFTELGPPPVEVTAYQLFEEYITDEAAANAKYDGKRITFVNVKVEILHSVQIDSANPPILYPVSNSVEFRPRYMTDSAWVREGYVVDIVGEVRGLFGFEQRYLVVDDCWMKIIEGEIGIEYVDPDY